MIKDKYGACYFPEVNIVTDSLTGKAKCIYEKIKNLNLFKETIGKFECLVLKYGYRLK